MYTSDDFNLMGQLFVELFTFILMTFTRSKLAIFEMGLTRNATETYVPGWMITQFFRQGISIQWESIHIDLTKESAQSTIIK